MTTHTKTNKGTKLATTVILDSGVKFYYSRPINAKKGGTYIDILSENPNTGYVSKVRLAGRQLTTLRSVLAEA